VLGPQEHFLLGSQSRGGHHTPGAVVPAAPPPPASRTAVRTARRRGRQLAMGRKVNSMQAALVSLQIIHMK
jgi:hypothetical protein